MEKRNFKSRLIFLFELKLLQRFSNTGHWWRSSSIAWKQLILVVNFLFGLRVNEIPNKTFILDSHRPFICSEVQSFINISWYFYTQQAIFRLQPDLICYDSPLKRGKDFKKEHKKVLLIWKSWSVSCNLTIQLSGDSNLAGFWSPKYNVEPTFLV